MKLGLSTVLQLLNILALACEWYAPQVPTEWMPYFTPFHLLVSAALHIIAGNSNPDGTSVRVAYLPPEAK